jgi:hypothetical protein
MTHFKYWRNYGKNKWRKRVGFSANDKNGMELKAIIKPEDVPIAQAINYLEACNPEVGLLSDFGSERLDFHGFTNKNLMRRLFDIPRLPFISKIPVSGL